MSRIRNKDTGIEIDIKGFVIYTGDIDDGLKVRFAKRFGGKG